jgi:hypothetical protein
LGFHTCHQCGTAVSSDEQFCTNCGSFLDPLSSPRPKSDNVISVNSDGNYEEFELGSRPPEEVTPTASKAPTPTTLKNLACPSCGASNPSNNRHCQECGARLLQGSLPTAPRPAVQATAGVRAALAISGLLFAVILVALLFNVFNGSSTASTTTVIAATTTSPPSGELAPADVISTSCDPIGIGSFVCDNLVSGTDEEFQTNWEDLQAAGTGVKIRITFRTPMVVTEIQWKNIADPTRFKQNYRARGLVITAKNNPTAYPKELEDLPGMQSFAFAAVNATSIDIEIASAWLAEVVDGNSFRDLAINEITIIGRPYTAPG